MPNFKNREGAGVVETDTLILGDATILQVAAQADSVAADVATLVADFNSLLAKLRTAGIMAE